MDKRDVRLSRREVLALAAVALGAGAFAFADRERKEREEAEVAAYKDDHRRSFAMGEVIRLDSAEDESDVAPDGLEFSAGFDWDGVMDVRIEEAALYDDPSEAGIASDDPSLRWDPACIVAEGEKTIFLLVKMSVANVDAVPKQPTRTGKNWFNISSIANFSASGDYSFFDGAPSQADEKLGEGFYYELPIGEEKTFRLGWAVVEQESYVIDIGAARGKYWVELDVQDRRGGDPR